MSTKTLRRENEAERFERIRRETGFGYGITPKDLAWLVRLVEKQQSAISTQQSATKPSTKAKPFAPFTMQPPLRSRSQGGLRRRGKSDS